ncbi:MAG: glycosyltransferase [Butyricimonas virosa]|uniref:glycosyltransferase n=1 Tax=Butyricimonas virosa TaxID=544645 RepID=UPI0022E952DC|nr:glycosyltransferase [Butyricimonas virosa]MCI7165244.1 glycosyltransferase [Butyricimonas virosa]MDY5011394.1 glycosyltransferase [Butyricimonas virosa]
MKVFILADASCVHTQRWANSLVNRDIDIYIFSLSKYDKKLYDPRISIYDYGYDRKDTNIYGYNWNKLRYLFSIKKIKKIIREIQPDILHAHYASSYGLLGALCNFHPYIISVWGTDVFDFPRFSSLHRFSFQFALNKADIILSTSHIMAEETQKYTSKTILETPFGIDPKVFYNRKYDRDFKEIVIGTVKTLDPKYGIDILILAFKLLCEEIRSVSLKLYIVGEGEQRGELEKLVGENNNVIFMGHQSHEKIPILLNRMDIYAALSKFDSESFGVAIIEASACELPVVVSDVGGLPEVVSDGETGIVVGKNDIQGAKEALKELVLNHKLREKMGKAGRDYVLKRYTWDDNVNLMMSIYKRILENE